jgi:hypothetical protein
MRQVANSVTAVTIIMAYYESTDPADHTLVSFGEPRSSRQKENRRKIRYKCEFAYGGYLITLLILTAARVRAAQFLAAVQEDLDDDDDSGMWNVFLDKVKDEDSRFTDAWKEDANSLVIFVSFNRLVRIFISITT